MGRGLNYFVISIIIVLSLVYAHKLEQWSVDVSLSALDISSFGGRYTFDFISWIPTFFLGLFLAVLIALLVAGAGSFWLSVFLAVVLGVHSFFIRKTFWVIEPEFLDIFVSEARHFMYLIGVLVVILSVRLYRKKLTNE